MDMDELFTFGNTRRTRAAIGGALRNAAKNSKMARHSLNLSSSVSEDASSSDEEEGGSTRRRGRKRSKGEESLAARLMHNKAIAIDVSEDDNSTRVKRHVTYPLGRDLSSSPSPPPPSPPPPSHYMSPPDLKSLKVFDKADEVIYQLKYSTPNPDYYAYSYDDESSFVTSPWNEPIKLRVRCRGKVHKIAVQKMDPFSEVCRKLASDLDARSDQVLLSHKTVTIKPTESPESLGLTTASIIDAIIMEERVVRPNDSMASLSSLDNSRKEGGSNIITIKVQSSKKLIKYKLAKTDPLQKAMTAFADALAIPLKKLRFLFDGDSVEPTQTAEDLEMENDDVMDARVID